MRLSVSVACRRAGGFLNLPLAGLQFPLALVHQLVRALEEFRNAGLIAVPGNAVGNDNSAGQVGRFVSLVHGLAELIEALVVIALDENGELVSAEAVDRAAFEEFANDSAGLAKVQVPGLACRTALPSQGTRACS